MLQAEICIWQAQPSPLLLGWESRHGFKTEIEVEICWDDIGWVEVVSPFFSFLLFHLVTSGQRQHGFGRTEFLIIRRCGPRMWTHGCDGGTWCADGVLTGLIWFGLIWTDLVCWFLFHYTMVGNTTKWYTMNQNDYIDHHLPTSGYRWMSQRYPKVSKRVPKMCQRSVSIHPFSSIF